MFNELLETEGFLKGQLRWWVWDAQDSAGRLAAGVANTSELRAVFWVRLGGVLIDVDERLGRTACEVLVAEIPQARIGGRAHARETAIAALEQLRGHFSMEELLYIEFQRDTQAHPYVDTYRHQLNAEATWKWKRSKILTASVQIEHLRDVIRSVNQRYGADPEAGAALDFARRSWQTLSALHLAVIPLTV